MNINDIFITDCSSNFEHFKCGDIIKIEKKSNGTVVASVGNHVIGISRSLNEGQIFNERVESKVIFINENSGSIRLISESI